MDIKNILNELLNATAHTLLEKINSDEVNPQYINAALKMLKDNNIVDTPEGGMALDELLEGLKDIDIDELRH